MIRSLLVLSLVFSFASHAQPSAPPAPPEVARTVDAFVGDWTMDSTLSLPGAQPEKAKLKMLCTKTALGRFVQCSANLTFPKSGPWEGAFLVGYDVETKAVHFFGMTSDPAVHDHTCAWKSAKEIVCTPLKTTSGGAPIVEDLAFSFGDRAFTLRSTTTTPDGVKIAFEAIGKK